VCPCSACVRAVKVSLGSRRRSCHSGIESIRNSTYARAGRPPRSHLERSVAGILLSPVTFLCLWHEIGMTRRRRLIYVTAVRGTVECSTSALTARRGAAAGRTLRRSRLGALHLIGLVHSAQHADMLRLSRSGNDHRRGCVLADGSAWHCPALPHRSAFARLAFARLAFQQPVAP